jgi:hypothetical protein
MANNRPSSPHYSFRKEIIADGEQKILLEVTHGYWNRSLAGYLTAVSKNVLTEAPIVIGPLNLPRDEWLALAKYCTEIAELLAKRGEKDAYRDEHKRKTRHEIY